MPRSEKWVESRFGDAMMARPLIPVI